MFCTKCGKEVPDGTKFCPDCGEPLSDAAGTKNIWECLCDLVKKFFVFVIEGRVGRKYFWGVTLFYFAFGVAAVVADSLIGNMADVPIADYYFGITMLPYLSVAFKRMHDVGKPAGFAFIPVYSLILCFQEGENGANQYGEKPEN